MNELTAPPTRTISLALQGGGSHGAFTWGVLDALLADRRIAIEGISGASAGAFNAVALASGHARGLAAGQQVRVASELATITVPLAVGTDTRPGVAVMSKGVWLREHSDGLGVNALTPATGDALGNGACFNDTYVTITATD